MTPHKNNLSTIKASLSLSMALCLLTASPVFGASLISDDPMETQVQSAPPNVMFVLDNSGSMDWEFIYGVSGTFHSHEYLYSPGDNNYSESQGNGNVLGYGDPNQKLEWHSQWAETNKIYYNPHTSYEPWARWEDMADTEGTPPHAADLVAPRSNPVHATPTYNLHDTYYDDLPIYEGVIVDDGDAAPYYVEYNAAGVADSGPWNNSGLSPEWAGQSRYTGTNNAYAVFTPDIPAADDYLIFAYINCFNNRDRNALIEVDADGDGVAENNQTWNQRATASNTPESGVCGEWLPMFGGASFSFPEGQHGTVTIKRTNTPDGGSTVADAIAFRPVGATDPVDVRVAHYYTVNDRVEETDPDYGKIYLVNFEWKDASADGGNDDGAVDADELVRKYYFVREGNADSDSYREVLSVSPIADAEVPAAIQPKVKNEDGTTTPLTDLQELQNFANWFSFYRRRELTAKAALSRTIDKLSNTYLGYYTINSGLRQGILPIKVREDVETITEEVISDNQDSTYSNNGYWYESGSAHEWDGSAYYTTSSGRYSTFTPNIAETDTYNVQAWWNCYNSRDQKAKITIHHSGGNTVEYYNQRSSGSNVTVSADCTDSSGSGCCGHWIDLGSYDFEAGTDGYVTIERHSGSTGSSTVADAIRFYTADSATETVDKRDELLNLLYGVNSNSGTPLRRALQAVGDYYDKDDSSQDSVLGISPFYPADKGGACQQTYAIAMTDGYWNGGSPGVGDADASSEAGSVYQDRYVTGSPGDYTIHDDDFYNTLADVAWTYWDMDLRDDLDDHMVVNKYDKNQRQHMVTYGIAFGLDGKIDPDDVNYDGEADDPSWRTDPYFFDDETIKPVWGEPTSEARCKIDDLWHAAVNGRGEFFSAKNPDDLVDSLTELFRNIAARDSSGASVSVNGDELISTIALYQSSYYSGNWTGDIKSFPIDIDLGTVSDVASWSAQAKLQEQFTSNETYWESGTNGRRVITFNGKWWDDNDEEKGVPFSYDNLSDNQKTALWHDENVVEYVRGKVISGFRSRDKMLGDIIHSAPLLISTIESSDSIDNDNDGEIDEFDEQTGGVIFAGGNDGMLHAFNADDGEEIMAYVPHHVYYRMHDLTDTDYEHRFFVDATPNYRRMRFLAGDHRLDGIDNDGDGCFDPCTQSDEHGKCSAIDSNGKKVDKPGESCPEGTDDEDYSDGVDNDNDGITDEPFETVQFTMLVGGMNKGGKGIYALNVNNIHDAAGKSETDLAEEMVMWEYPAAPTYTYTGDQSGDGNDNDGDGCYDNDLTVGTGAPGCDEMDDGNSEDYSDTVEDDGDIHTDEEGELNYTAPDPDMGFTFSTPYIVKSNKPGKATFDEDDSSWVVIFGNGYQSDNGSAVLYVLDAFNGTLIRKIDAGTAANGARGGNGLSEPAIVDVNNDGRIDFVYAGDLKGNMWKFDLSDTDPKNWGVAFGINNDDITDQGVRIDAADDDGTGDPDLPEPLITVRSDDGNTQPITTAPDVMFHPSYGKDGYLVVFASGKYLGADDQTNNDKQTIYGIWDYGMNSTEYLGNWNGSSLSNLTTTTDATLLEQTVVYYGMHGPTGEETYMRVFSDHTINWYTSNDCKDTIDNDSDGCTENNTKATDPGESCDEYADEHWETCVPTSYTAYGSDGLDNNNNGDTDITDDPGEATGHAGWFFDLPYGPGTDKLDNDDDSLIDEADEEAMAAGGERVIKDLMIRGGRIISLSFVPSDSPCKGGGDSLLNEQNAENGGRVSKHRPSFDVNGDGLINEDDLITITDEDGNEITVAPTSALHSGMLHTPVIVKDTDDSKDRELKIFSTSAGDTTTVWEAREKEGTFYWHER